MSPGNVHIAYTSRETNFDIQMLAAGGQMPQISAGGSVMMTLHQVNGDGAGPYECMIDSTGTGTQWTAMEVATNVPGTDSRSKAKATDFVSDHTGNQKPLLAPFQPLTAKVAADQTCTGSMGGVDGMCMVRCNNAASEYASSPQSTSLLTRPRCWTFWRLCPSSDGRRWYRQCYSSSCQTSQIICGLKVLSLFSREGLPSHWQRWGPVWHYIVYLIK